MHFSHVAAKFQQSPFDSINVFVDNNLEVTVENSHEDADKSLGFSLKDRNKEVENPQSTITEDGHEEENKSLIVPMHDFHEKTGQPQQHKQRLLYP